MITIVTGNTRKFEEMQHALAVYGISVQREAMDIDEIQANTGLEVVVDKVQKAFAEVKGPVLVDDSGIYFEKYTNFPGVYSKFIYQTLGLRGMWKLLKRGDAAAFHCYVAYMEEGMSTPHIFHGEYSGTLTDRFDMDKEYEMPYAPMFIPNGERQVMAEMTPEQRMNDHRNTALREFAQWYTSRTT